MQRSPPPAIELEMNKHGPNQSETELDSECSVSTRRIKRKALRSPELVNSFKLEGTLKAFQSQISEHMSKLFSAFQKDQDDKFSTLMTDVNVIKQEVQDIKASNKETERKLNLLTTQYENVTTKITQLSTDSETYHNKLKTLESKIEFLDKQLCVYKLELRNVPIEPQETPQNLLSKVQSLLDTLEIKTSPSDIRRVTRLPGKPTAPRPIVIEVINSELKRKIIEQARNFNKHNEAGKLNTSHLAIPGTQKPIYIGELLTYKTKELFYKTRELAKQNNYAFCWTSNGQVCLREKEGAKILYIKNEEQLENMLHTA